MSDFTTFKNSFKGDIVTQDDPDYATAISRWSVAAERTAKYVAFVKDTDDIAAAIKFARNNNLEIAIKGGGHNPSAASSTKGGLVVDPSKYIKYVDVDPEKKLARVGGGALWSDVDETCIKHGRSLGNCFLIFLLMISVQVSQRLRAPSITYVYSMNSADFSN